MDLFEALYTTRAMRRVKRDPVPADVQARILDAAIRSPSGGNAQRWRFLLVDDPGVKGELGPLYRRAMERVWEDVYAERIAHARAHPEDPEAAQFLAVQRSAQWLQEHFEEVPLYLFAFSRGDRSGGSIFPAVWSAMLAARAYGVGSCLTSAFNFFVTEMLEVLAVPPQEGWTFAACVSFGYPTGRWAVAARQPVTEVAYRNRWGQGVDLSIPEPLWSAETSAG
jgi:nitroreductase